MPTVQIADDKKYGKAIGLLLEMGGIFRTKPTRQLVIGPAQLQTLQMAGLVTAGAFALRDDAKSWAVPDQATRPGSSSAFCVAVRSHTKPRSLPQR
jgi:hypothetical protein